MTAQFSGTRRMTIPAGYYGVVTDAPGHCNTTRIKRVYEAGKTMIARTGETGSVMRADTEYQWSKGDFYGDPVAGHI